MSDTWTKQTQRSFSLHSPSGNRGCELPGPLTPGPRNKRPDHPGAHPFSSSTSARVAARPDRGAGALTRRPAPNYRVETAPAGPRPNSCRHPHGLSLSHFPRANRRPPPPPPASHHHQHHDRQHHDRRPQDRPKPEAGDRAAAGSASRRRQPIPHHPAKAQQPVAAPTDGRMDPAPEPQELLVPPFTLIHGRARRRPGARAGRRRAAGSSPRDPAANHQLQTQLPGKGSSGNS